MVRKLLILLVALQTTPNMTVVWQARSLHVTWHAPGWHCLSLDRAVLDCRYDQADLLLPTGGVDAAYAPRPGQVLRLVDAGANETARAVVPARVFTVRAPWVRG